MVRFILVIFCRSNFSVVAIKSQSCSPNKSVTRFICPLLNLYFNSLACQATSQPNPPEPIKSAPMPRCPWDKVKIDIYIYGPLPTWQCIRVVIDCYSRFPEVEIMSTISAQKVIPKLYVIFARHGVPSQVTSDNGPPFQSNEFHRYMTAIGVKHTTSTLLWPQGNAEAEAFMKPLGKAIRTAHLEKRPWQQELPKFLLNYRATPHSTTKVPPAELLYNREIRGKSPALPRSAKVTIRHPEAKDNQEKEKRKGKMYADKHRHTHNQVKSKETEQIFNNLCSYTLHWENSHDTGIQGYRHSVKT